MHFLIQLMFSKVLKILFPRKSLDRHYILWKYSEKSTMIYKSAAPPRPPVLWVTRDQGLSRRDAEKPNIDSPSVMKKISCK